MIPPPPPRPSADMDPGYLPRMTRSLWMLEAEVFAFKAAILVAVLLLLLLLVPWALRLLDLYLSYAKWAGGYR